MGDRALHAPLPPLPPTPPTQERTKKGQIPRPHPHPPPLQVIVGLQCDAPLKRAIKPLGGVGVVKSALAAYGKQLPQDLEQIYTHIRKTHNQGGWPWMRGWVGVGG